MNNYIVALPDSRQVTVVAESEDKAREQAERLWSGKPPKVTLVCVSVLEMAKPGVSQEVISRWRLQRVHKDSLHPEPNGCLRSWVGKPEERDWFLLEALMTRMGYCVVSHRREFREGGHCGEVADWSEMGATMPRVPGM